MRERLFYEKEKRRKKRKISRYGLKFIVYAKKRSVMKNDEKKSSVLNTVV